MGRTTLWVILLAFAAVARGAAPARAVERESAASPIDSLAFGVADSEHAHSLAADHSETIVGALGVPARRLLPGGAEAWEGGRLAFVMKVDPRETNYFTVRFWGGEADSNLLILFCQGKQVGYRHLGDVDVLALPDDEPRYNGRFYYVTTPLPLALTRGQTEARFEIRSTGTIWGYGSNFQQYQKDMTGPTRGLYAAYVHADGCFVPPAGEVQGEAPPLAVRNAPGPETLDAARHRVNEALKSMLASRGALDQMKLQFLAKAYSVRWSAGWRQKAVIEQVVKGVDHLYARWKADPAELWRDKATWNPGWFGVGPAGDAVRLRATELAGALDETLPDGSTRRADWSRMFRASRDWLGENRRWLSNQAMFTDVNLYLCNRAIAAIDPASALPETKARDYLYQSIGLVPWLGSNTAHGPAKPFGDDFFQVTDKGLTRELGYAGNYGELGVANAMEIYDATRGQQPEGDPRIKAQLAKMLRARLPFRYPAPDEAGFKAMRLERCVGWRDDRLPGLVDYVQAPLGEQSELRVAAATLDPAAVGAAQQMFDDNQFFASVARQLADKRLRSTVGLLGLPDQYDLVRRQPAAHAPLPMSPGQGDFIFSDEEDGVVAIRHGPETLYASLYWRAGFGVNFLARVHDILPRFERTAVVEEEIRYDPSGLTYKRPDWINFGFGNGGVQIHYPRDLHQALAGEALPIARMPSGVEFKAGDSNHFAGRGEFYVLRYGRYVIAMNMTAGKTFSLKAPESDRPILDLSAGGKPLAGGSELEVGPRTTRVLWLGDS